MPRNKKKVPRTVVIGGSSGMGFAIAQAAKDNGHEVIVASRSQEKLASARKILGRAETHVLDITQEKKIEQFFSSIDFLDHLVITAASFVMGPFLTLETAKARAFFDSKFWGQFCVAKYAAPKIRAGGSITFFCGTASQKPLMNFSAGSAINGAIEGLTRALALELAPLRVNAVAPGVIDTPVWEALPKKKRLEIFQETAKKLPVRRIGQPEDIAKGVLYLMECGFSTGSILYIDGGDRLL